MNPKTLSGLAAVLAAVLPLGGCGAAFKNDGHMFQRWAEAVASIPVTPEDAQAKGQETPVTLAEAAPARPAAPMQVELVDPLQMPTAKAAGLRAAIAVVDSQLDGLRREITPAPTIALASETRSAAGGLVQLASFSDEASARRAWAILKGSRGQALAGLQARFERVDLGPKGVWVRLKAGPVADVAQAEQVCGVAAANPRWCAQAFGRSGA
jgi:hypothetical protein